MKRTVLLLALILGALLSAQQTATVEKSITGLQIGFFGAEVYNEARLSDQVSLRSQLSFLPSIWGGDFYSKTGFALAPALSLTPKYYYNLTKRAEKGKNTKNNAANYIAAELQYVPNWFVISNVEGVQVNPSLSIIPHYGFRRNFATHFNYEFKAGVGIGAILKKGYGLQVPIELSFKVGYDF